MSYKKMDPELKREWIEALRSGEYKQGEGQLREARPSGTFHCCLGVLNEVAGWGYSGDSEDVADEIDPQAQEVLVVMNDEGLLPFTEIADWIEVHL